MSTVRVKPSEIEKLLSGGDADVVIESDETVGFNFKNFVLSNEGVQMTFNNGYTILRNRAGIYKTIKSGKFTFQGKTIVIPSANVSPNQDDWTFRRLEGFIRAKMLVELIETKNEKEKQKMYEKICGLPLVSAYGLKPSSKSDATTAKIVLTLGGPLTLLASLDIFAATALPLAYFQNVKKEALGISRFSTYEQLCKVARVMAAKEFKFTEKYKKVFGETVKILTDCTPGTSGAASLIKFNEQIKILEGAFGKIVEDIGESPKPKNPSKKDRYN
uniref:Nucleoprotein n=1 Tax=Iris yellow spot virus TaxID=60456 RepID=B2C7R5_9VIRU|nr:nucleocapsid protein [Iris yellow spot virus]